MQKKEVQHIDVLSAAKIQGAIGVGIGLITGVLMALGGVGAGVMGNMMGFAHGMQAISAFAGIFAVVGLPIVYGIGGFIGGIIGAFLYNLAAGFVGGVVLSFRDGEEERASHARETETAENGETM